LSGFEPLDDWHLDRMTDEELVAYVVDAFSAGHYEAGRRAAGMVVWRQQPLIEVRVAAKVPTQHCEDVVSAVLKSFVESAFRGKVIHSVRAFVMTIAQRRIADFHRERERHPDQIPLVGEHVGEDDAYGEEESVEDETEVVAFMDAIERVLAGRSEVHRQVIRLYGPEPVAGEDLPAKEVVARMQAEHGESISEANVQQIWHRFKVDLEKELSAGEDVDAADD
jgi:DNA-directed RNA polymerase specialized sigma24 family protein